ncbi:MAG: hypothetical protein H6707_17100 [Deltaproteobacteria bacterium]|nr:hypothetical protein [Deltaproteobacteria bacterium]
MTDQAQPSGTAQPAVTWELQPIDGGLRVIIRGVIDEYADLRPLLSEIDAPPILELGEVRRINSLGVKIWVGFIEQLSQRYPTKLARCSPAIVAQLNSVYNFRGTATIESVLAPFYCERCDVEQLENILTNVKIERPKELLAGQRSCNRCGGIIEFDDLPDRYFMFAWAINEAR